MQKVVVIGGGGHAKAVISLLKKILKYTVIGYLDPKGANTVLGIPCLGNDSQLPFIKKKNPDCVAVIGVGGARPSEARVDIKRKLETFGYHLPAFVSPNAVVNEDVQIGKGTVILDGVVVNAGTRIGECVILNTSCSIDHDCVIEDFVHVAPSATLCGGVHVGLNSMIGAGSTILQYKKVGQSCLIGAGAIVVDDCCEPGTYLGTPARKKENVMGLAR